jgi:hypothetical protein
MRSHIAIFHAEETGEDIEREEGTGAAHIAYIREREVQHGKGSSLLCIHNRSPSTQSHLSHKFNFNPSQTTIHKFATAMNAPNITTFAALAGTKLKELQLFVDVMVTSKIRLAPEDALKENLRALQGHLSRLPGGDTYTSGLWGLSPKAKKMEAELCTRKTPVTIEDLNDLATKWWRLSVDLRALLNQMKENAQADERDNASKAPTVASTGGFTEAPGATEDHSDVPAQGCGTCAACSEEAEAARRFASTYTAQGSAQLSTGVFETMALQATQVRIRNGSVAGSTSTYCRRWLFNASGPRDADPFMTLFRATLQPSFPGTSARSTRSQTGGPPTTKGDGTESPPSTSTDVRSLSEILSTLRFQ